MKHEINAMALRRMITYLAYLKSYSGRLPQYVSAPMIANALQLGEVQVRKDLAQVARPGYRKIGRDKEGLIDDLEKSIGLDRPMRAVVIGADDFLPWLLAQCAGHIQILGYFGEKRGSRKANVRPLSELTAFCKKHQVQVGILNVSSDMLYVTADLLQDAGIQAIWNFSSVPMAPQENVQIQNENLLPSLGVFSYFAKIENSDHDKKSDLAYLLFILFQPFKGLQPHFLPSNTIGLAAGSVACNKKENIVLLKRFCFHCFFCPLLPWLTYLLSSTDTLQCFFGGSVENAGWNIRLGQSHELKVAGVRIVRKKY